MQFADNEAEPIAQNKMEKEIMLSLTSISQMLI